MLFVHVVNAELDDCGVIISRAGRAYLQTIALFACLLSLRCKSVTHVLRSPRSVTLAAGGKVRHQAFRER